MGDLKRKNRLGARSVAGALASNAGGFGGGFAMKAIGGRVTSRIMRVKGWNAGRKQVKMKKSGNAAKSKVYKKQKHKAYAAATKGKAHSLGAKGGELLWEVNEWR